MRALLIGILAAAAVSSGTPHSTAAPDVTAQPREIYERFGFDVTWKPGGCLTKTRTFVVGATGGGARSLFRAISVEICAVQAPVLLMSNGEEANPSGYCQKEKCWRVSVRARFSLKPEVVDRKFDLRGLEPPRWCLALYGPSGGINSLKDHSECVNSDTPGSTWPVMRAAYEKHAPTSFVWEVEGVSWAREEHIMKLLKTVAIKLSTGYGEPKPSRLRLQVLHEGAVERGDFLHTRPAVTNVGNAPLVLAEKGDVFVWVELRRDAKSSIHTAFKLHPEHPVTLQPGETRLLEERLTRIPDAMPPGRYEVRGRAEAKGAPPATYTGTYAVVPGRHKCPFGQWSVRGTIWSSPSLVLGGEEWKWTAVCTAAPELKVKGVSNATLVGWTFDIVPSDARFVGRIEGAPTVKHMQGRFAGLTSEISANVVIAGVSAGFIFASHDAGAMLTAVRYDVDGVATALLEQGADVAGDAAFTSRYESAVREAAKNDAALAKDLRVPCGPGSLTAKALKKVFSVKVCALVGYTRAAELPQG